MLDFTSNLLPLQAMILERFQALHANAGQLLRPVKTRADLGEITSRGGVYLIYERNLQVGPEWTLVYIGTEKRVRLRVSQHLFYPLDSSTKHKGYRVEDNPQLDFGVLCQEVRPIEIREYVEHVLIENLVPSLRDNIHA